MYFYTSNSIIKLKTQLSIIGCGWLGLPLAKALITKGYAIKGSTTSTTKLKTLQKDGINSFLIRLDSNGVLGNYNDFLSGSETIIINIPPGLRKNPNKNHVIELQHLINAIEASKVKNVIYVSSTTVFKDETHFPVITENTSTNGITNSAKQLIEIETMLKNNTNFNTSIIRFGGLFDAQRHPARYLSGKANVANPKAPVNLIHKNDCITIISKLLDKKLLNVVLNAVNPEHPSKATYYTAYCKAHQLALPNFNLTQESKGKAVDSTKLEQLLDFRFQYKL